jgi:hypothetical protein
MPISSLNKLASGQVTFLQTFNECQLESHLYYRNLPNI